LLALTLDEQSSDRAEAWLANEVCAVVEELIPSKSFQLLARWSVDRLSPGVHTNERRLVEAVDQAIVRGATELAGAMAGRPSQLVEYEQARFIAGRPWFDLVCPEEYFHAERGLHFLHSHSEHTAAFQARQELRVPLGDYVLRSMLARIDYWKSILARIWNRVFHPTDRGDDLAQHPRERLFAAHVELDQAIERLTSACCAGSERSRREACVILTQVYAAYSAAPNLSWLGCPPGFGMAHRDLIRSCVRRRGERLTAARDRHGLLQIRNREHSSLCDPEVLRGVAGALSDVSVLYEMPEDPDDLVDWAKDRARLVMVDRSPRSVFWQGKAVDEAAWDERPKEWNLLWTLASNLGRPVDQAMLMAAGTHPIKSRRNRLTKMLNSALELDALVESIRSQGYVLRLKTDEVILLQDAGNNRLVFQSRRS